MLAEESNVEEPKTTLWFDKGVESTRRCPNTLGRLALTHGKGWSKDGSERVMCEQDQGCFADTLANCQAAMQACAVIEPARVAELVWPTRRPKGQGTPRELKECTVDLYGTRGMSAMHAANDHSRNARFIDNVRNDKPLSAIISGNQVIHEVWAGIPVHTPRVKLVSLGKEPLPTGLTGPPMRGIAQVSLVYIRTLQGRLCPQNTGVDGVIVPCSARRPVNSVRNHIVDGQHGSHERKFRCRGRGDWSTRVSVRCHRCLGKVAVQSRAAGED